MYVYIYICTLEVPTRLTHKQPRGTTIALLLMVCYCCFTSPSSLYYRHTFVTLILTLQHSQSTEQSDSLLVSLSISTSHIQGEASLYPTTPHWPPKNTQHPTTYPPFTAITETSVYVSLGYVYTDELSAHLIHVYIYICVYIYTQRG